MEEALIIYASICFIIVIIWITFEKENDMDIACEGCGINEKFCLNKFATLNGKLYCTHCIKILNAERKRRYNSKFKNIPAIPDDFEGYH